MFITFLIGTLAILAWLYATSADRRALHMMWIGLLYVLLASVLNALLSFAGVLTSWAESYWWFSLEMILLAPVIEELVKSHAARSQRVAIHSFALVCLFGIYELMLSKPAAMLETVGWPALVEALDALPALTMHILTAAVYSFAVTGHRKIQIAICIVIHAVFNGLLVAGLFSFLPLVSGLAIVATIWLFPWKDESKRGQWSST